MRSSSLQMQTQHIYVTFRLAVLRGPLSTLLTRREIMFEKPTNQFPALETHKSFPAPTLKFFPNIRVHCEFFFSNFHSFRSYANYAHKPKRIERPKSRMANSYSARQIWSSGVQAMNWPEIRTKSGENSTSALFAPLASNDSDSLTFPFHLLIVL